MSGVVFLIGLLFASELFAGLEGVSSDSRAGLLHTITHLHPAAYFVLFLIAVLSAVNLFLQRRMSGGLLAFSRIRLLFGTGQGRTSETSRIRGPLSRQTAAAPRKKTSCMPASEISKELLENGVVSVSCRVQEVDSATVSNIPTPLDGTNHPIPDFAAKVEARSGSPRMSETRSQKEAPASDFKFSSAIDLLSREEMERREKEQFVVSGSVVGPDGEGIPDVLVFLTDVEGNRVGQSFRSIPETGEFKVLANEPGKYVLNGHKRGLIVESSDPLVLPIDSGRLDGYSFCMIPEGCVVHGKVIIEAPETALGGLEIRCVCSGKDFYRAGITDSIGGFRVTGVPMNSQCVVEVRNKDGNLLASSEAFDTARKKEIHLDLTIGSLSLTGNATPDNLEAPDPSGQTSKQSTAQSAGPLQ